MAAGIVLDRISAAIPDAGGRQPPVAEPARTDVLLDTGEKLSSLRWGEGDAKRVLLHGRGQNAYTWRRVADALPGASVGIDLPGHGDSDWRDDHDYGPWKTADAVAGVVQRLAPSAEVIVGMSLGGSTTIRLAARFPELVRRAVVIDTTPGGRPDLIDFTPEQQGATALLDGPLDFESFEEMVEVVAATLPNRSLDSVRRSVGYNARQREDGRWIWRYDRLTPLGGFSPQPRSLLWDDVSAIHAPLMLVVAGRSGRIQPEAVEEMRRRQPGVRVEYVADSGHSVQSEQPLLLAELIHDFVSTT
jgi:pimeloyl-ACP methyl ester carboxylesterase